MQLGRSYLVWRALSVLCEIARADEAGETVSDAALRFLLAFLFAASDGNRAPYDIFFNELRSERGVHPQHAYRRPSYLNSGVAGIVRSVGPNPTGALLSAIGAGGSFAAFRAEVQRQIDMGERKLVRPDAWV